jgi:hypothetical protein
VSYSGSSCWGPRVAKNDGNPAKLATSRMGFLGKRASRSCQSFRRPSFFRIPEKSSARFAYGFQGIRRQVENRAFMVASCAESEGLKRRAKKPRTGGAGLRVLGGNYETRRHIGSPRIGACALARFADSPAVPSYQSFKRPSLNAGRLDRADIAPVFFGLETPHGGLVRPTEAMQGK